MGPPNHPRNSSVHGLLVARALTGLPEASRVVQVAALLDSKRNVQGRELENNPGAHFTYLQ